MTEETNEDEKEFTIDEYKNIVKNLKHNYIQMQKAFKSAERKQQARTWALGVVVDLAKASRSPMSPEQAIICADKLVPYAMVQLEEIDPTIGDIEGNA